MSEQETLIWCDACVKGVEQFSIGLVNGAMGPHLCWQCGQPGRHILPAVLSAKLKLDGPVIDTLTVNFWKEPNPEAGWGCHIGPDWCGGIGGFGATPLEALVDLAENIGKAEGYPTDNKKLFLR